MMATFTPCGNEDSPSKTSKQVVALMESIRDELVEIKAVLLEINQPKITVRDVTVKNIRDK